MHSTSVDVIVCTWNRCDQLRPTLDSIMAASAPPGTTVKVLVVDNNSTDPTREVVHATKGPYPIEYLFVAEQGLSVARNAGLRETGAEIVAFTDDDVRVSRDWLTALVEGTRTHQAAVYGGPVTALFDGEPRPELLAAFPSLATGFCGIDHQQDDGDLQPGRYVFGANIAFRRCRLSAEPFDRALGNRGHSQGGFEETDLQDQLRAAGERIVWLSAMRVQHFVPRSRMDIAYLRRFTVDRTRGAALRDPDILARYPRLDWLGSAIAQAYGRAFKARMRGDTLGWYKELAEAWRIRGIVKAVRFRRHARIA